MVSLSKNDCNIAVYQLKLLTGKKRVSAAPFRLKCGTYILHDLECILVEIIIFYAIILVS